MRKNSLQKILSGMALLCLSLHITIKGASSEAYSVGNLSGQLTVSDMGAAVYSLTFDVPDGGPLTPQIGIAYNSQKSGYRLAGYGFDITGISCITRGGKDLFHDKTLQGVTYTDDDNYFLDGKRLILKEGQHGKDGSKYCLEGDPYTEVLMHNKVKTTYIFHDPGAGDVYYDNPIQFQGVPDSLITRSDEIISWFEVTINGINYTYGNTDDSRWMMKDQKDNPFVAAWYINRQEDSFGNFVDYKYETNNDLHIRPSRILYSSSNAKKRGKECRITFNYQGLKNVRDFYIKDRKGLIQKVLSSVVSYSGKNTYRKYTFTYDEKYDTGYQKWDRLTTVSVANGKEEQLRPVEFNWERKPSMTICSNHINVVTKDTFQNRKEGNKHFIASDINGDGISDIVRINSVSHENDYSWLGVYVSRSQINNNGDISFQEPNLYIVNEPLSINCIRTQSDGINICDLDGDGYNDLILSYNSHVSGDYNKEDFYFIFGKNDVHSNNTNNYGIDEGWYETELKSKTGIAIFLTADIDNDGRSEVIALENEKTNGKYHLFIQKYGHGKFEAQYDMYLSLLQKPERIYANDYNNDGLVDLLILTDDNYVIYYNNGGKLSASYFAENNSKVGASMCDHYKVEQGDFNGDGQLDFVYSKSYSNSLWVAYNNGDGTFTTKETKNIIVGDEKTTSDNGRFTLMASDINHDGLTDIFYYKVLNAGQNARWILSTGNGFILDKEYQKKKNYDDADNGRVFVGDFDGDGYPELANYGSDLRSTNKEATEGINVYNCGTNLSSVGKITRITDGMGNVSEITYSTLTKPDVYTKSYKNHFPVNAYTIPLSVVKQLSSDNGPSSRQTVKYKYENLKAHVGGRGMLGFGTVTQENLTLGTKTVTSITDWDTLRWIPQKVEQWNYIGDNYAKTTSFYTIADTTTKRKTYFPYVSRAEATDMDGNSTLSVYEYDTELGVIKKECISQDGEGMYKSVYYTDYETRNGVHLPGTVTKVQKHSDDGAPFSTATHYTYNDKGNVLSTIANYGSTMPLTTTMTYDDYGNVLTSVTAGNGVMVKACYEYDDTKRFLVKTYTEPASSVKTFTYDVWGNVQTETDSTNASFPLVTRYEYDAWGRKISMTDALGLMTRYETGWGTSDDKKYYTKVTGEGNAPVTTWYDKAGREVLQETIGQKGIVVSTATTYNGKGQVEQVVRKKGRLTVTSQYTYDERGRVLEESSSTGSFVNYQYGNRTTQTTVAGRSTTQTFDAWGNVVKVVDPISNVSYKYCSNGQPKSVTSGSTTVTMTYDEVGNQTALQDPDAGTMTYAYAADGKMLSQTDAKGVKTVFEYDELGRVITTRIGDKTITNTYGTAGNEILQLTKQTMDGNVLEYTHDEYGRVKTEKRTVGQMGVYEFKYNYNRLGQLEDKLYPGGVKESYQYDQYGFKTNTFANGMVIYKVDDYDGLKKQTSFAEDLRRTTTHDAKGYLSCKRLTLGGTDTELENFQVTYDYETGNLLSRQRNTNPEEVFGYDALDRLTSVKVGSSNRLTMTYAANGNILQKSDVGEFSYSNILHPHAVTRIKKQIKDEKEGDALKTQFNALGKIRLILDTRTEWAQEFVYGPDQQRWCSWLTDDISTVSTDEQLEQMKGNETTIIAEGAGRRTADDLRTTIYASGYEKVSEEGKTREYYYLDGGVIAVKQDGVFTPYLAFTDNLGSILAVYDAEGKKVFDAEYDAWGKQTVSLNEIGLQRGYTGHEMLNEFGIINMNGRLYDPVLGRFFSPDNYVQAPDNSQNFNRYSYCLNNPLKYNDPSGECWGIIVGAVIGAYIGGVLANDSYNPTKWDYHSPQTWGYVMSGAIVGGLSAGAGAAVAGLDVTCSNTLGIMTASAVNSLGTYAYTLGKTPISVSAGAVSYDFTNGKFGYLGKKGNSKLENWMYSFGALANVQDLATFAWGGNGQTICANSRRGHFSTTDVNGDVILSATYDQSNIDINSLAEEYGINLIEGKPHDLKGRINWLKFQKRSVPVKNTSPTGFGESGTWSAKLYNVSRKALDNYAKQMEHWNLTLKSCVGHTTWAYWRAGIPVLYVADPRAMSVQIFARQIGIWSSPYLYDINK